MESRIGSTGFHTRRRRLPHWTAENVTYFLTFRLRTSKLTSAERAMILEHVRSGGKRFYDLSAIVVMPDYVHLILRPRSGYSLPHIMQGIKGATAYKLNNLRGTSGTVWQDESWDRILRNDREYEEKLNYMLSNPVKAGLCKDGWDYDGWFYNPDFE